MIKFQDNTGCCCLLMGIASVAITALIVVACYKGIVYLLS